MKKGAVAGAIVWSTPLLTSTPAFAATGECAGSQPCTTWYYAKTELDACSSGSAGDGSDDPKKGNGCVNLLDDVGCPGESVSGFADGCTLLESAGTFSHTGSYATVTFPADSIPLYIQIKPGSECYTYKWDGSEFDFHAGTDGTNVGPGACLTNATVDGSIPAVKLSDGKIKVEVQWNQGGGCAGISHFNAYFCL